MTKPNLDNVTQDGAYMVQEGGITNYGERWSYGYIVPIRELKTSDVKRGTLFLVVNDGPNDRDYLFANHVDDLLTANRIARDTKQKMIYDLRERRWRTP